MSVTLYGIPNCDTVKKARSWLDANGIAYTFHDYKKAGGDAAKLKSGSGEPNRKKVASVTWDVIRTIADDKMVDLNAFTVEKAMSMIAGTARSMGITVTGQAPF